MDTPQTLSPKKRLFSVIGLAVGISIGYFTVHELFFRPPAFDKTMVQIASEMNKTCPMMIDNITRLDNTIALPGHILEYNYTLINVNGETVDTNMAKKNIEPNIINTIKTNPGMKALRENN